ncbi:putative iron-dependent peroxidase [Nocardia sp. GAS34]|uniref:Dyp-type peroxidase n=1 Tax=unclassified Nocardia TaxID=2637762 RepID=UPI003D1C9994
MTKAPAESQHIAPPATASALFLVLEIGADRAALARARAVLAATDDLVGDILVRAGETTFGCTAGISHRLWEPLTHTAAPRELHPFKEFRGAAHAAVSTPGDLLYHVRSDSTDLIVEFEKILLSRFGDAVTVVDEVTGFRYFDGRDLLQFADGTANPNGAALLEDIVVGDEDPDHAGGSYVVVQKYLHDLAAWERETTETQQRIIGRTKFDNVELPDATAGQKAHKTLCTITDDIGEYDILRDNMPFAVPGRNVYGTYFIGYSRRLWVIEKMLERMFLGDPPPLHDRILDYSTAVTGLSFFAPARGFLSGLDG